MNIYDVTFADGTTERRTLMFLGPVPSPFRTMKRLQQVCGRTDIVRVFRPLANKVVWEEARGRFDRADNR